MRAIPQARYQNKFSHRQGRPTSKYRNKKVTVDGHQFDSKKEAHYYLWLKKQVIERKILCFQCQPIIKLFPDPERNTHVKYIPDFKITRNDKSVYYVDVKSKITIKDNYYILKRKLLKWIFPKIEFIEVV